MELVPGLPDVPPLPDEFLTPGEPGELGRFLASRDHLHASAAAAGRFTQEGLMVAAARDYRRMAEDLETKLRGGAPVRDPAPLRPVLLNPPRVIVFDD